VYFKEGSDIALLLKGVMNDITSQRKGIATKPCTPSKGASEIIYAAGKFFSQAMAIDPAAHFPERITLRYEIIKKLGEGAYGYVWFIIVT
jgi:hypothetical protein